MRTVALVELNRWGHHEVYFKFMTKTLLELGYQVVALCPYPSEIEKWIASEVPNHTKSLYCYQFHEVEDVSASTKTDWLKRRLSSLIKTKPLIITLKRWYHASICLHAASSKFGLTLDLVFFAYLDNYLGSHLARHVLDYVFSYKWSGLYVLPFHLRDLKFVRNEPHSLLLSPNCQAVAVLDEGISGKLQASINSKPVIVFPDFADAALPDREFKVAKQIEEKARGRRIITLIGALERRKGFLRMLEVSQIVRDENYFFVFAGGFREGSFSPEEATKVKSIVNSKPSNCFFHFDYVPDEAKYNSLIEVSDVLWVVYDFPHSAQTLAKAALFEKPVLVGNNTCTSERVQKFQMGISVDKDSTIECVDALRKLNDQLKSNDGTIQPNYESYRHTHSIEQLNLKFKTLLNLAIKDNVITMHRTC